MFRSYRSLAIACLMVMAMATTGLAAQGKAKSASITGTLQKVDGQTLTIQTSKGTETVMLAPTAQIRRGSKTLGATDLSSETGARVKVTYTETNGQKQARMVSVSSATQASAKKAGTAKKS
jgi:ABC-type enterochelin transport system substrate-binding protein